MPQNSSGQHVDPYVKWRFYGSFMDSQLPLHSTAIQLQLLVCNTQARVGIPFGKDNFDHL